MEKRHLVEQIVQKRSFLCVGLDTDLTKIPEHLLQEQDPIFEFNKQIIDHTHDIAIAYKPNTAFYEACGAKGWVALEKTIRYINENYPKIFTIADAKRGDIGNTSRMYAEAFFNQLNFDAVTVAPYMGENSVTPFLEYQDKWTILLALTSNESATDFQFFSQGQKELYKKVIDTSMAWQNSNRLMYVVGATKASYLKEIRDMLPNHFILVPGVGAQAGSLEQVCKYAMTKDIGIIVNSSRGIIYADRSEDFAQAARTKALQIQRDMEKWMNKLL